VLYNQFSDLRFNKALLVDRGEWRSSRTDDQFIVTGRVRVNEAVGGVKCCVNSDCDSGELLSVLL